MTIKIINYSDEYFDRLMEFNRKIFPQRKDIEASILFKIFQNPFSKCHRDMYLALDEDKIIGQYFLIASKYVNKCKADQISWGCDWYIDTDYLGSGVGRSLATAAVNGCNHIGMGSTPKAKKIHLALKQNFRWHDAPFIFILNSPDNMGGIVMASIINEPSGIHELIDYQTPRKYSGTMIDVFQYNMTTPDDGVKVEQTGPMQLKVSFNQWGNWWHSNGIGGTSYENEYYKAETLDFPYLLTFKQLPEGSVIIYQDGSEWKEFRFTNAEEKQ